MTNTASKPCKICHTIKSLTEFSKDSQVKSGISNRCKACDKIKNSKRGKGFTWQDATDIPAIPEDDFTGLYGASDAPNTASNVRVRGKLVMRKGVIIDNEWYQKKLCQLRKGKRKEK